jgi:hypothetical protein
MYTRKHLRRSVVFVVTGVSVAACCGSPSGLQAPYPEPDESIPNYISLTACFLPLCVVCGRCGRVSQPPQTRSKLSDIYRPTKQAGERHVRITTASRQNIRKLFYIRLILILHKKTFLYTINFNSNDLPF